ncbi:MAG: DUF1697 domain-containing protein [Anaeromyxobacteraceae bacterium]
MRFVALLRGINVGGRNLIRMTALKACFEAQGFGRVETFIQSGNVLFDATGSGRALAPGIERALSEAFGYAASVVVRSRAELERVVAAAPRGFGAATHRCDVVFLKAPLDARTALRHVKVREGVDEVHAGPGVLYFSRVAKLAASSQLVRIVQTPIYPSVTIRNWNTTTRLLALLRG